MTHSQGISNDIRGPRKTVIHIWRKIIGWIIKKILAANLRAVEGGVGRIHFTVPNANHVRHPAPSAPEGIATRGEITAHGEILNAVDANATDDYGVPYLHELIVLDKYIQVKVSPLISGAVGCHPPVAAPKCIPGNRQVS